VVGVASGDSVKPQVAKVNFCGIHSVERMNTFTTPRACQLFFVSAVYISAAQSASVPNPASPLIWPWARLGIRLPQRALDQVIPQTSPGRLQRESVESQPRRALILLERISESPAVVIGVAACDLS